jgi:hypothetical protein
LQRIYIYYYQESFWIATETTTMLPAGRVAALLLLVAVLVVASLDPAIAGCCFPSVCTNQQKDRIIQQCKNPYLRRDNPVRRIPSINHACCQVVREFMIIDDSPDRRKVLQCIGRRFTSKEKREYDPTLLLHFAIYCGQT